MSQPTFTNNPTSAIICEQCGGLVWGVYGGHIHNCICPKYANNYKHVGDTWECPRCHTIHHIFKQSCDCAPPTYTMSSTTNPPYILNANGTEPPPSDVYLPNSGIFY